MQRDCVLHREPVIARIEIHQNHSKPLLSDTKTLHKTISLCLLGCNFRRLGGCRHLSRSLSIRPTEDSTCWLLALLQNVFFGHFSAAVLV